MSQNMENGVNVSRPHPPKVRGVVYGQECHYDQRKYRTSTEKRPGRPLVGKKQRA